MRRRTREPTVTPITPRRSQGNRARGTASRWRGGSVMFGRQRHTGYTDERRPRVGLAAVERRQRDRARADSHLISELKWQWRSACQGTPLAPIVYTPSGPTRAVPVDRPRRPRTAGHLHGQDPSGPDDRRLRRLGSGDRAGVRCGGAGGHPARPAVGEDRLRAAPRARGRAGHTGGTRPRGAPARGLTASPQAVASYRLNWASSRSRSRTTARSTSSSSSPRSRSRTNSSRSARIISVRSRR